MYFDDLVTEMKRIHKSPVTLFNIFLILQLLWSITKRIFFKAEIRKAITDIIQEEYYKLKEVAAKFHEQHISAKKN